MVGTATSRTRGLMTAESIRLDPSHVFVAGLCVAPAFLFQGDVLLRWLQVAQFILLSAAAGKRIRVLPNVVMITGIVAAQLLTPIGEVLVTLGGFRVTRGALMSGLEKSALLIGMIYLSRFMIRKGFVLPGRLGSLLSLVFFYFEKTLEGERLGRGNLIEKIDERIAAVHASAAEYMSAGDHCGDQRDDYRTSWAGWCYLCLILAFNWGLMLASMLRG